MGCKCTKKKILLKLLKQNMQLQTLDDKIKKLKLKQFLGEGMCGGKVSNP